MRVHIFTCSPHVTSFVVYDDREDTINRIENLTSQIAALNTDLENQELENDRVADLLEAERLANLKAKEALEAKQAEVLSLQEAIAKKDATIAQLETTLAAEASDDESEGITEEIIEEYKDAMQFIPKAMRLEVAKNLELFGLNDEDGNIDMDMLDSVLEDGLNPEEQPNQKELYSDDDFSFQKINRRISEVPTRQSFSTKGNKHTQQHSNTPSGFTSRAKAEVVLRQPSQSDQLLEKYANVVRVQPRVRTEVVTISSPLPNVTAEPSPSLMTEVVSSDSTDTDEISPLKAPPTRSQAQAQSPTEGSQSQSRGSSSSSSSDRNKKPLIKHMSLSSVSTHARAAAFQKQTSLGAEGKRPLAHPLLQRESSVVAKLRGMRRQMSKIDVFDEQKIQEMKEEGIRKAKLKKNIMQLIPVLAPFIKPDQKITLKVVATAIRFLVRFKNAINASDFPAMGALGRREEVTRLHNHYGQYTSIIEHLEKKVTHYKINEEKYITQVETMAETIKKLREMNREHIKKAAAYADNMEHIQRDLTRQHIIGQCQRNFAAELSETLGIIRNRIYMMIKYEGDIPVPLKEDEAKKLEDKSLDFRELTEEQEEEERLHLQERVNYLFRKLRVHVIDVSHFVQENKLISPITTFALGRFPDFYSFSSKFRNELRNLKLFKGRALSGKNLRLLSLSYCFFI